MAQIARPQDIGGLAAVQGSLIRKRKFDIFNDDQTNEYFTAVYEEVRKFAVLKRSRRYSTQRGDDDKENPRVLPAHCREVDRERKAGDPKAHGVADSREASGAGCSGWNGGGSKRNQRDFDIPKELKEAAEKAGKGSDDKNDQGDDDDGSDDDKDEDEGEDVAPNSAFDEDDDWGTWAARSKKKKKKKYIQCIQCNQRHSSYAQCNQRHLSYLGEDDEENTGIRTQHCREVERERKVGDPKTHGACDSREPLGTGCSGWRGGGDRRNAKEFDIPKVLKDAAENGRNGANDDGEDDGDGDGGEEPAAVLASASRPRHDYEAPSSFFRTYGVPVYSSLNDLMSIDINALQADLEQFQIALGSELLAQLLEKPYGRLSADQATELADRMRILPFIHEHLSSISDRIYTARFSPDYRPTYNQIEQFADDLAPSRIGEFIPDYYEYRRVARRMHWWLLGELYHRQNSTRNSLVWDSWEDMAVQRTEINNWQRTRYGGLEPSPPSPVGPHDEQLPDTEGYIQDDLDASNAATDYGNTASFLDTYYDDDMADIDSSHEHEVPDFRSDPGDETAGIESSFETRDEDDGDTAMADTVDPYDAQSSLNFADEERDVWG